MKGKLILLMLMVPNMWAQGQQRWLNRAGGAGNDESFDMVRDANGDYYLTGYFSFGSQFGQQTLVAAGSTDVFVAKVRGTDGQLLWAKQFGGEGADAGIAVAAVPGGGVAVTGYFEGQAAFGGLQVSAVAGSQDIFVLRLSANGDVMWVRSGGGPDSDIPYGISVDPFGNIVTTGAFKGVANFNGQAMVSITDPVLLEPSYDIYILKYSPTGALLWGLQGAAEYEDRGMAIATDQWGHIYVAGQFSDTITFNNTYNNSAFNTGFLMRLDPDGQEQWLLRFAATLCLPRSIAVRPDGKVFVTGDFMGNMAVFGPQTVYASNPFPKKIFLARFDADGSADWVSTLGSDNQLSVQKVALDDNGDAYVAGDFRCAFSELTPEYDEGVFYSAGFRDIFTLKYSGEGIRLWEHHMGGPRDNRVGGLAVRMADRPVVAGSFQASFNLPYVPQAFQFNPGANQLFPGANYATLNYCGDASYARFVSAVSAGQRDVFITDAYNPSRSAYDYFERSGPECLRPYLDPQVNFGAQQAMACDSVLIELRTRTDTANRIGPIHTYQWSNGLQVDSFWVYASELLTVVTSRMDGCRVFYDTIDAVVSPPAVPPLVSDDQGINTFAPPDAAPISLCYPDQATVWGEDMQPGHTYRWETTGGTFYTDTITVSQTAVLYRIAETEAGCLDTNIVLISVDDFANFEPLDPHLHVFNPDESLLVGDTMYICWLDTFRVRVFDSLMVSGFPYSMPYCGFLWSHSPPELISLLPDISSANNRRYSVNQSGWVTISVTVSDGCNTDYGPYELSKTFYLNMFEWQNNPAVTGPSDICPGDTVMLMASGGQSYQWSGPGVVQPDTGSTVWVTHGGTYVLTSTVLTEEGCYNQDTVRFKLPVREAPLINMNPALGIICPYDSVLMTLPFGSGYQWIGPDGSVIGTGQSVYAQTAGPYYGTMTDPQGCALVSDGVELAEYTSPYIVAEPSLTLCEGQTITLEVFANDGSLLQWAAPLSGSGYYNTVSDTGTYSVSATLCGITETVSVTITPFNLPIQAVVVGADSLCNGAVALLAASPAYPLMEWSDGSQSQYLQTEEAGAYYVTIQDDSGCEAVSEPVFIYYYPTLPIPAGTDTIACQGDTVWLSPTVPDGLQLLWSQGNGTPQWQAAPVPFPIGPVGVTVQGVLAFTDSICTGSATSVTINAVPASGIPQVVGPTSLCLGDTLAFSLTDTGSALIQWQLPDLSVVAGGQLVLPSPQAGEYVLSIDPLWCPTIDTVLTVAVHVPMHPTLAVSSTVFCANDTAIVSVGGVSSLLWHPSMSLGNTLTVSGEGAHVIHLTAIDSNGCAVASDTVLLTGLPYPVAIVPSDTAICQWEDAEIVLFQQGVSHEWAFGGTIGPIVSDTISLPSLGEAGWVVVVPFDSLCTGSPDSFFVDVIPFPSIASLPDSMLVCYHGPLLLGVEGVAGVEVTWQGPGGGLSVSDSLLVQVPQGGDYIVSASNAGCSVTDTVAVGILPPVEVAVTSAGPFALCPGASLAMSGPAGFVTYQWMPGGGATASLNVSNPGAYALTVIDTSQCTHSSDTVQVLALAPPVLPILLADTTLCQGQGLTISIGETSLVCHWLLNGSVTATGQSYTLAVPTHGTQVTLRVTDLVTGCITNGSPAIVSVIAQPLLQPSVAPGSACERAEAILSAASLPEVSYAWAGPMGQQFNEPTVTLSPLTLSQQGNYVLTAGLGHCEWAYPAVSLTVRPLPSPPDIAGNARICEGDTLRLSLSHPAGASMQWADPLPGSHLDAELELADAQAWMSGLYGAVAEAEGCVGDTAWLEVAIAVAPILTLGSDTVICDDTDLLLYVDEALFSSVSWTTGESAHFVHISESGTYGVTAWTDGGCVLRDSMELEAIDCDPIVPNVFTPNGDGSNELFTLYKRGVAAQYVTIYNRWGHIVYVLSSVEDSWDGTHRITGIPEPDGTYYYVAEVELISGRTVSTRNWLALLR